MPCHTRVQEFFDFYQELDKNSTPRLADFYTSEAIFEDPLHRIEGVNALIRYFDGLYAGVESIQFHFASPVIQADRVWVDWRMVYQHRRLKKGQPIEVEGASRLDWQGDQVCHHRDYFDAGQMLYQHLPLMGWAIGQLKQRLAV
ncbi:nuclear transport factor 2 family protein [Marinospirillum sp.]|uniref:nuclear transport factor 2 family protein n=1 Tax=Marinospirillum sp. TaxID=2183934 RepID=UPI003A864B9F